MTPHRDFCACLVAAVVVALVVTGAPGRARADDWPGWRGPNRDGISAETGWLTRWPAGGPTILWRTSVGKGFSSVSVSRGRLYTMGNADGRDTVWCLDAETGKPLWMHSYPCPAGPHAGTRMTPTIDGDVIYTYSRAGHIFCLDAATGAVRWKRKLVEKQKARWGYATSPLVLGKMLILETGHKKGSVVALDKTTGKIIWQSGKEAVGYSSPMVYRQGEKTSILMFCGTALLGLEAKTGKQLWRFPWKTGRYTNHCATPIISGSRVFISTAYGGGGALLDIASGSPRAVYKTDEMHNHFNNCVLWKGYLYGFDGGRGQKAYLKCLDFGTGEVKWAQDDLGKGSLMIADDKLVIMSETGELAIAEATPDVYRELSRAKVLTGRCWTMPVLSNGRIYCRNHNGDLLCVDVRGR